jgi:hypothetical protein
MHNRSLSWVSDASPELTSAVVRRDRQMFMQTSTCRVLVTLAALAGLAFETVDYETHYSLRRTHDNCKQEEGSATLRWMNVSLTLVAAVFACLEHITTNEAKQYSLLSPQKLNKTLFFFIPRGKVGLALLIDLAILAIFPYPYVSGEVRLTEHEYTESLYKWTDVCYTVSEILYLCSFARLYFLARNVLYLIGYVDTHSRQVCRENRVKPGISFTLRSFVRLRPITMALVFILPTALVLGVFLRVFERPYMDISTLDYEPYYNSLWLSLMTISTVNYADFYPTTHLGRVVALICGLWGLFLVSMMVYVIDRNFSLSDREEKALFQIKNTRAAAKLVISGLAYNYAKMNTPNEAELYKEKLYRQMLIYREERQAIKATRDELKSDTQPLHAKIKELKTLLERLESSLAHNTRR